MATTVEENPMEGVLERLAGSIGRRVGAGVVFGAPVERDGVTIVPVAVSRFGFGGGGGPTPDGGGHGEGGGGGAVSRPYGFIEMSGGQARFRRVGASPALVALVLLALIGALIALRRGGCRSSHRDPADDPEAGAPGNA